MYVKRLDNKELKNEWLSAAWNRRPGKVKSSPFLQPDGI